MSAGSFTFRCGECNRLLGISRSRVGTVVSCPKCGRELVVPDPGDGPAPGGAPGSGAGPSASGSDEAAAVAAGAGTGAAGFPALQIEPEPLSLRPKEPARPYRVPDRRPAAPEPASGSEASGTGFVAVQAEETLRERPRTAPSPELRAAPRSGDVVMPRTAFLLWSFAMLVALVGAFGAGLLAGHLFWPAGAGAAPTAVAASAPAAKAAPAP